MAVEADLVVIERRKALSVSALLAGVLGALLFLSYFVTHFGPGLFGVHLVMLAGFVRLAQLMGNFGARRKVRRVRVAEDGVEIDGVRLARSEISHGYYQPRPPRKDGTSASTVRLQDRRRRLLFEAEVTEDTPAIQILRTLGLDATSKRAEFPAAPPLVGSASKRIGFVVAMLVFAVSMPLFLGGTGARAAHPFVMAGVIAVMTLLTTIPAKVVVAVDGILVRWLWTRRYIPMADVIGVVAEEDRVVRVRLASGKDEVIYAGAKKQGSSLVDPRARRDAMYARIVEAWNAYRERGPTADVAAVVARGTRTHEDWRRALAELERRDPGYRGAAVRDEDLWRVVEDPRATEDARAGAAVLLRKTLDEEGKARVRVAAEATASPRLRVALGAAAADSDEALDAALEEIAVVSDRLRA